MRLPQMFNDTDEFNVKPKPDDDQMMGRADDVKPNVFKGNKQMGKAGRPINAEIYWTNYLKNFETISREQLIDSMQQSLLQIHPDYTTDLIKNYADAQSKESFIKTATIQIMSTPEYQMC